MTHEETQTRLARQGIEHEYRGWILTPMIRWPGEKMRIGWALTLNRDGGETLPVCSTLEGARAAVDHEMDGPFMLHGVRKNEMVHGYECKNGCIHDDPRCTVSPADSDPATGETYGDPV